MSIIHMDGFDHYIDEIEVSEENFTDINYGTYSSSTNNHSDNDDIMSYFKFPRHFNSYVHNTSSVIFLEDPGYSIGGSTYSRTLTSSGIMTFIGKNLLGKSIMLSQEYGYDSSSNVDAFTTSIQIKKDLKSPFDGSETLISGLCFYPHIQASINNDVSFRGEEEGSPTILQIICEKENGTYYNLAYCMYEDIGNTENRIHFTTEQSYRSGMSNYSGINYRRSFDNQMVDLSWNYVEVKINITTRTALFRINGNRSVELKLNDYLFEGTEPILNNESNIKIFIGNRDPGHGSRLETQYRFAIDDLYVLDGNGTTNNDFLGNVKVLTRTPDNDVQNNFQRYPTTSTNNYENVDSIYDDSIEDPDYNYANTVGTTDLFTSSHVVPEDVKIHGIGTAFISRKQAGDSKNVTQIISNGTTSSEGELLNYNLDNYTGQITVFDKDPDGNDWTKETIETSQFGYEIKDTNIT